MKGDRLGEFEELVLLTVLSLDPQAYGVPIRERLEEAAERLVSIGAVYAALERLEGKGFLRSLLGGATHERGGRRKRFFSLTPAGVRILAKTRTIRERIWHELDARAPSGTAF